MSLQIDHSRLNAVNAVHSTKALQLMAATERLQGKSIRKAFSGLAGKCTAFESMVESTLSSAVPRNADAVFSLQEDGTLESQLMCQIQKVLGIMAILINEQEADIAAMNDLIDLISVMDRDFFAFASLDIEDVLQGRSPVTILMTLAQRYLEKAA